MMKKTILSLAALLAAFTLSAQVIRTNYRSEGMTHISTDFEKGENFETRIELVGFPDGSELYQLYIDLRQKSAFTAPKGVKMTATLSGGTLVRADQIGRESATKSRLEDGLYLNRLRYALEADDMEKLSRGVRTLELATGWGPEDFLTFQFTDDAFGALLRRHCEAIEKAKASTVSLTAEAAGRVDQATSIMTAATPIVIPGRDFQYNLILNHLYYKTSAKEDIDLAFQLGTETPYRITPDAPVTFLLADGTERTFPQTRDEVNFIYLYPSLEDLRALAYGQVTELRIRTEEGLLTDAIPDNSFSKAINQQYQLLMSLSAR